MLGYGNNTVMWQISFVQSLNMIIPTQMNFEWAGIHHRRLICILLLKLEVILSVTFYRL